MTQAPCSAKKAEEYSNESCNMTRVVLNLLLNALLFMNKKQHVLILGESQSECEVPASVQGELSVRSIDFSLLRLLFSLHIYCI